MLSAFCPWPPLAGRAFWSDIEQITDHSFGRRWLRDDVLPPANRECDVAHYFFHVMDGRAFVDTEGTELAGLPEMRAEAIRAAGEILADQGKVFGKGNTWQMTVADAAGDAGLTLRFSAVDQGWLVDFCFFFFGFPPAFPSEHRPLPLPLGF